MNDSNRSASVWQLFSNADLLDYLLMAVGTLTSILSGLSLPFFNILYGKMADSINEEGDISSDVNEVALYLTLLGVANFFTCSIELYCWSLTGHRQTQRAREIYLEAILSQEIGWFDTCGANELSTKMSETLNKIEDGLSRKIGEVIRYTSQFIGSFIVAFYLNWRISLVVSAVVPIVTFSTFYVAGAINSAQNRALEQYSKAGGLVTETLSSIHTVTALNLQFTLLKRYRKYIFEALLIGIRKGFTVGIGQGTLIGSNFLSYSVGYWYAGTVLADALRGDCQGRCITGGEVIATFHSVVNGSIALGQLTPSLLAFFGAKAAYVNVLDVLKRKPLIDESSTHGLKPSTKLTGKIEISNLCFTYPSRPHVKVYENFNLSIASGETVALVGSSGCGKSTIVNLLMRFYDATLGEIKLDGEDIKGLNTSWLRGQIGYVGQEPILFSGTIAENIAYGLDPLLKAGSLDGNGESELMTKVKEAAKLANAYDFIMDFPDGFNTKLNSLGLSVSGGQKQRIAIARALIKKPAILLLDEATSALDSASEKIVQESIDKLAQNKAQTTIIIAHRLSTIKNADKICVLQGGIVAELGTHEELIAGNNYYSDLIKLQFDNFMNDDASENNDSSSLTISESIPAAASSELVSDPSNVDEEAGLSTKKEKNDEAETTDFEKQKLRKIMKNYLLEHKGYCILAILGGAIAGGVFPLWGYLLAQTNGTMFKKDPDLIEERSTVLAGLYGVIAFVALVSSFFQYYGIIVLGEMIAARVRSELFEAYLRQEISFFDSEDNSINVLAARLSEDARILNKSFGESLVKLIQAFFCLVIAIFLGFFASWEMSLLLLGCLPINIVTSSFQMKAFLASSESDDVKINYTDKIEPVNGKYTKKQLKILRDRENIPRGGSGAVISLAFLNMRTISAFSLQGKIKREYSQVTKYLTKKKIKKCVVAAVTYGLSSADFFLNYALLFWVGSRLIIEGRINFTELITAIMCLMFGAHGLANALADMGDQASAFKSASRIFNTIEKSKNLPSGKDNLSTYSKLTEEQEKNLKNNLHGQIEFKNVSFCYPMRPEAEVCKNFNFTILPGETVALVGPSGSGKSTIISLLLRFYENQTGDILLDGINIKDLNLRFLRAQIGYVGQEPCLFEGNVLDNIKYGRNSNLSSESLVPLNLAFKMAYDEKKAMGEDVSYNDFSAYFNKHCKPKREPSPAVKKTDEPIPEDVLESAIQANAHDFITEFPDGYLTEIGQRSLMVSGGQKQRIAIARALIKKPAILLLDEATSALDSASEKIVQESIDKLAQNKAQTTIIIAHRLSTIKNVDKIIVVDKGEVVEIGNHEELLSNSNGIYNMLWNKQNSS